MYTIYSFFGSPPPLQQTTSTNLQQQLIGGFSEAQKLIKDLGGLNDDPSVTSILIFHNIPLSPLSPPLYPRLALLALLALVLICLLTSTPHSNFALQQYHQN
jgi:hypothetical protein